MSKYHDQLARYDELVALCKNFKRKGKTMPYTSANGYMFSLLNKDAELGIRLSKESQNKFLENYNSGPLKSHGATMRDYVKIPDDLLQDTKTMVKYLEESYKFVMSLPPK